MSDLNWKLTNPMQPDTWSADSDRGAWRVHLNEGKYRLSFQPRLTRGMLNQGSYDSLTQAQTLAQSAEDGTPIVIPTHLL